MLRRAAAAAIALALVVAACGGDDDDAVSTDPPAAGSAAPAPAEPGSSDPGATTPSSAGGEAPAVRGGTLRYGDANGPSRFDPHRSTIGQDIRFFAPVYDRLVHFDEVGELTPGLATEWSFNEAGTEFTMTLREGVTFHDGAPFDSAAVKANIERGQTIEGSSISADLADITSIATPDPMTVVFTLSRPNSMLPGLLSHRAGSMVSPTAFENPDLDRAPVGAGPYRVVEYVEGDRIIYERYEDHWDTEAGGPDRIELRILPDPTTRLNALRSGELDMTTVGGGQLTEAETAGFTIDSGPGLTYLVLYLNRARAEFDDALVRRAMNHAIDRQAIIDAVLLGAGDAAVQPFPENYYAYNPDYPGDYFEFDPERARELLAEAGLEDGFSFEMLVTNLDTYMRAGEAVQQMLADVGIEATIRTVEAAQTADVYYAQEEGDALVSQWGGRPDPQMTLELQFTSTGFSNPGRHTTDEMEAANETTRAAVDPAEREAALQAETAIVVEEAFQVPIAHDYGNFVYGAAVTSFSRLVTGQPNFPGISMADAD